MWRSVPQIPACVTAINTSREPMDGIGVFGDQVSPGWGLVFLIASIVCTHMRAEARTPSRAVNCDIPILLHIKHPFDIIDRIAFDLQEQNSSMVEKRKSRKMAAQKNPPVTEPVGTLLRD